jgi:hypothetical protein
MQTPTPHHYRVDFDNGKTPLMGQIREGKEEAVAWPVK